MLSLTKRVDYGLMAMVALAGSESALSSRGLSERLGVSPSLLANVLKELSSGGLVTSVRGKNGGYRLASDPAFVTVSGVIAALEGPFQLAGCTGEEDAAGCELSGCCSIKWSVNRIHESIAELLSQVTVADLLADAKAGATAVFSEGGSAARSFRDVPLNLEV